MKSKHDAAWMLVEYRGTSARTHVLSGAYPYGTMTIGTGEGCDVDLGALPGEPIVGMFSAGEGALTYRHVAEGTHARIISEDGSVDAADTCSVKVGDIIIIDPPFHSGRDAAIFVVSREKHNIAEIHPLHMHSKAHIGRVAGCEIRLEHGSVSELHALIAKKRNGYTLKPFASEGILTVNAAAVRSEQVLNKSDVIFIGDIKAIFMGDSLLTVMPPERGIGISIRNLCKDVKDENHFGRKKQILDHVSLDVLPGEMIAIVGGSGAGKTTLLDAMSGYSKATGGQVFVDGIDYHKNAAFLKNYIGYVPQQDIVHDKLTLMSMLMYSAELRMPASTSQAERKKRVEDVIKIVHLKGQEKNLIKKMSGGQRKRASIAVELLANPNLFFLDEPTSGLDPNTEFELLNSLREICESGKTVLLVTHSTLYLERFDKVIVMGRGGRLCYYGPYSGFEEYFGTADIKAVYTMLDKDEEAKKYQRQFLMASGTAYADANSQKTQVKMSPPRGVSWMRQLSILTRRYTNLTMRRLIQSKFMVLLLLPVIFGSLLGGIVGDGLYVEFGDTRIFSFVMACCSMWIGLFLSIQEIAGERPIVRREAKANMKLSAYILSKTIVLSILSVLQTLLMCAIFAFIANLRHKNVPTEHITALVPFFENWLSIELVCLSSVTMGLFISSITQKPEGFAPYLLMAQFILPGVLIALPPMLEWAKTLSCTYWGNRALCISADVNELGYQSAIKQVGALASNIFTRDDDYSLDLENLRTCWQMLLIIWVAPLFASMAGLIRIRNEER